MSNNALIEKVNECIDVLQDAQRTVVDGAVQIGSAAQDAQTAIETANEARTYGLEAKSAAEASETAATASQTAATAAQTAATAAQSAAETAKDIVTVGGYAKDAEVAHLAGAETITGPKTFTNSIVAGFNGPIIKRVVDSVELGATYPSGTDTEFVTLANAQDKDGTNFCLLASAVYWHKNVMSFFSAINKTDSGETVNAQIALVASNAGDTNANCYCNLLPATTNKYSLGMSSNLWANIFCATSSINTSDEREKTAISDYPDSLLDAWANVNFKQFKFKDAVAEKGANARVHSGLIAQQVQSALAAYGLDATKYGLFCYDEWTAKPEVKDQDGNIIQEAQEAGDKYGLRYEECFAVEAAYLRRENSQLKAQLTDVTARLADVLTRLAKLEAK